MTKGTKPPVSARHGTPRAEDLSGGTAWSSMTEVVPFVKQPPPHPWPGDGG